MKAKQQRMRMEIKEISADGTFEGRLAVYNNVDLGKELIEPGAFTKTIQEHGSEVPLLWQHKADEPIGMLTLADSQEALNVKGRLLMDLPMAQKAYLLIKARVIKGLSIGFDTIKDSVEAGVRHLNELRLWEGSIVTFPMNEAATITAVKKRKDDGGVSETKEDFNTELAEVQLQDAGYQMRCALFQALGSLIWASGMTRDEKVSAAQVIIEQFSEAFLMYLPQYLDWLAAEYGDMEMMGRLQREEKSFGELLGRGAASMKQIRQYYSIDARGTDPTAIDQRVKQAILTAHGLEVKEGRRFSGDTLKSLQEAHGHVKSLDDIFTALIDAEADDDSEDEDDDTSEEKAANQKPEPEFIHSAAKSLEQLRSLLRTA